VKRVFPPKSDCRESPRGSSKATTREETEPSEYVKGALTQDGCEAEGLEGRVICHECLLALRRGVGPAGGGNSGGDAVDQEVGPFDIFT